MTEPLIEPTRRRLGPAPRTIRDTVLPPAFMPWLGQKPHANALWAKRLEIARTGYVTLGAIVMANNLLWGPSEHDCPAQVVYSAAPWEREARFSLLDTVGRECMQLRGRSWADPALDGVAKLLDAEDVFTVDYPVPSVLAFGESLKTGATLIPRGFLPLGYLSVTMIPLFVPRDLPYVLPIPFGLWDHDLVALAKDGASW